MTQYNHQDNKESKNLDSGQNKPPVSESLHLLVEEWKKNVDLYIDQDKRGLQRITMFILIHAGLLTFYSQIYKEDFLGVLVIAVIGLFLTFITKRVSNRAHACILLRSIQCMLIENKLKKIIESKVGKEVLWQSLSGIITTFTREHMFSRMHFGENIPGKWQPLMDEVKDVLDKYEANIFDKNWRPSIGHLRWLELIYNTVYILWILLIILSLFKNLQFFLQKLFCVFCGYNK